MKNIKQKYKVACIFCNKNVQKDDYVLTTILENNGLQIEPICRWCYNKRFGNESEV